MKCDRQPEQTTVTQQGWPLPFPPRLKAAAQIQLTDLGEPRLHMHFKWF